MEFLLFFIVYFILSIVLLQVWGIVVPTWLIYLVFIIFAIIKIGKIIYNSKYKNEEEDK